MTRIAIVGARAHHALGQVWQFVRDHERFELVSGGADGPDRVGEEAHLENRGVVDIFPVSSDEWHTIGKRAGHVRNGRMVASGLDACEAFVCGESRGTYDMIRQCEAAKVPVTIHEPPPPHCLIQSARIGYIGKHALDISRKSGKGNGLLFAPSWDILNPVIKLRRELDALLEDTIGADVIARDYAESMENAAWADYVPRFTDEMRRSFASNRDRWIDVIREPRVVLLCYCTHKAHCHRHLVRSMLAKVGRSVGREVVDGGDMDWQKWHCKPWKRG